MTHFSQKKSKKNDLLISRLLQFGLPNSYFKDRLCANQG